MDYYMHFLPGKIRIRTSALRKSRSKIHSAGRLVRALVGVTQVSINQDLGSIVIHYDRDAISYHVIINAMADGGFVPSFQWKTTKLSPQPSLRFSLASELQNTNLSQNRGAN